MPADGGGSQALLSVVTALTTTLSAFAAVWFPLIAGPRYRLLYGPMKPKQLGDGSWEVNIYLSSRGRRDITREAFDKEQPVELGIGVPIRKLTHVLSSQPALRTVTHHAEGTCLLVGPGLIGRRQDLRFDVITDTEPASVTCQASLIDVHVRRGCLMPGQRFLVIMVLAAGVWGLAWGLVLLLLNLNDVWINPLISIPVTIISEVAVYMWVLLRYNNPLFIR